MRPPRALVIVNRTSRSGEADLTPGLARLQEAGVEVIKVVTDEHEKFPGLIREHRGKIDRVIVGGGDGTLNRCIESLIDTRLPLGVIPLGTANNLARTLDIPLDVEAAFRVISQGQRRAIDVGFVNGLYFFNAANIGLGADIASKVSGDKERKSRLGIFAYVSAAVSEVGRRRPFSATIVCDDRRYRIRSLHVAVGNGRLYGTAMTIAREAAIDDGLLFLYSIAPRSLWRLLALAPRLQRGEQGRSEGVLLLKGREIRVETDTSMEINVDGETLSRTPATFCVFPKALEVFVAAQPATSSHAA